MKIQNLIDQLNKAHGIIAKSGMNTDSYNEASEILLSVKLKLNDMIIPLPSSFHNMPERLKKEMLKRHSHAEMENDINPSEIVYSEKYVIELMNIVRSGNF